MRILITGAAGFVGSNLAERLVALGHSVIGIDNFSHGKRENVAHLNEDLFMLIEHDFSKPIDIADCDLIIHLASEKIPRYSDSFNTLSANQLMTANAVDLALKYKCPLMFASTSDVYGKNENSPFKEGDPLVMGDSTVKRWSYAVSKIHSEHYIIAAHDRFGLDYVIMRFFSAYGPRQAEGWWGGVQSAFLCNILAGKEIEIHGDGTQARCFTYIDDLIDGIILCMGARNEIFNLGNPNNLITVNQLASMIYSLTGITGTINRIPYSSLGKYEDNKVKIPNIDKARAYGFQPKVNLIDGLTKTIQWHTETKR